MEKGFVHNSQRKGAVVLHLQSCEKAARDERAFIPCQSFGLGKLASSDAMLDAAGVEDGYGTTKPHLVNSWLAHEILSPAEPRFRASIFETRILSEKDCAAYGKLCYNITRIPPQSPGQVPTSFSTTSTIGNLNTRKEALETSVQNPRCRNHSRKGVRSEATKRARLHPRLPILASLTSNPILVSNYQVSAILMSRSTSASLAYSKTKILPEERKSIAMVDQWKPILRGKDLKGDSSLIVM